jgi:hypothetical protein
MDQIYFVRMESLQARTVKDTGLTLRLGGKEVVTGTISGVLDESAGPSLGTVNATTGVIHLRWSILATLPIVADLLASGQLSDAERGVLRVSFEEVGQMASDGSGFDSVGTASIAPGSLLSKAEIMAHSQLVRVVDRKNPSIVKALSRGQSVRCAFLPESRVEARLPRNLGGGNHSLNLLGGFVLVPIYTFGRLPRARGKKK